jgi:hypothetical protein
MENRKRKYEIRVRLNEAERDRLAEKMKYAGAANREGYIRQLIMNGFNVKVDSSEIREHVRLLGNIAHNVNQIARRANETRSIYESDVRDLKDLCAKASELARESLKAQQGQAEKVRSLLRELEKPRQARQG